MQRILLPLALVLLFLFGIANTSLVEAFNLPGLNRAEKVKESNNVISIPVAKIDNKARFFTMSDGSKEIRFFAIKGSNGAIRVAFDACDACFREKKGYEQKDDRMVCRNCNMKFPVDRLGPNATGGCNPGFLPHRIEGSAIIINAADVKAGTRYF